VSTRTEKKSQIGALHEAARQFPFWSTGEISAENRALQARVVYLQAKLFKIRKSKIESEKQAPTIA